MASGRTTTGSRVVREIESRGNRPRRYSRMFDCQTRGAYIEIVYGDDDYSIRGDLCERFEFVAVVFRASHSLLVVALSAVKIDRVWRQSVTRSTFLSVPNCRASYRR
jgi:hypothetical protein